MISTYSRDTIRYLDLAQYGVPGMFGILVVGDDGDIVWADDVNDYFDPDGTVDTFSFGELSVRVHEEVMARATMANIFHDIFELITGERM